jgi:hypothetical protein
MIFNFGTFEEIAHDKIIKILIFHKFAIIPASQVIEAIYFCDHSDNELHKDTGFIHN